MTKSARLTFGLLALLIPLYPSAQTVYPEKPIRLVVPFPPGSQRDTLARLLGQKFSEALGKPVVIDNVSGAAGNIGAERVAKAMPDGYTLGLLGQGEIAINPSLYKLPYDPVGDLTPICEVTVSPVMLVVHNAVPAKSVKELVALAKSRPGAVTFASGGSGTANHMATELFKSTAGIDIQHIAYRSVVAAMPDLISGRVIMMFTPIAQILAVVREGKLRPLAVTSLKRSPALPELPTIAEAGYPGFEFMQWHGLFAPARTPAAIVRVLHLESVKALEVPDLRTKLVGLGLDVVGNSPGDFVKVIRSEIPVWAKVIKDAGIKPD
jgi:tripartite-type tricarboxylate transporter receptor subunit TctC